MKLIITLILSLFIVSCSTTPAIKRGGEEVTGRTQRPEPPPKTKIPAKATPESLFAAARKAFDAKDYNRAYDFNMHASESWKGQPRELEALVWADRSLFRSGRFHESADMSEALLKRATWNEQLTGELTSYYFKSLENINDNFVALTVAMSAQTNPLLVKEKESYRLKAIEIVESKLGVTELEKVSGDSQFGDLRSAAAFRLGEMSLDAKDPDSARRYFSRAISVAEQSEWAIRSKDILDQLEAVRRVEPKTVGVVLPMTGRSAAISQKILRGVQMGLGLYGNVPSSFKLAVVDSEGNPDNARRGVERLVKEDNVIAVIGSVLSKNAPAVAAKSSELGVPSINLSQKSGITEAAPTVFRNSLTSEMQVRYLVKTAMEDLGMKRFAILYPNDLYGIEFANEFWDEVLARGGTIVGAQTYSAKETDFRYPIQRLVGTYYVEARADEYRLRLNEWTKAQTKRSARVTPPDDLLPPITDFDAIFIPDSAKALGQISAMLSYNGVKSPKLLGTNLWNIPDIAKRAGHFANNLLFVDSFVATDKRFASSQFIKEYKAVFNETPGIFEVQGYDAALLLRQLVSKGHTSRESLTRALSGVADFPGAIGPLSMTPDREILRPLVALTLENGAVVPFTKVKTP